MEGLLVAACGAVVVLAALLSNRFFAVGGLMRTMNVVLIGAGVASLVGLGSAGITKSAQRHAALWPLHMLLAVDTMVRVITALRGAPDFRSGALYVLYATLPLLALLAALQVGLVVGERFPALAKWIFGAVIGITVFVALMQWAASAGLANPFASGVDAWNTHVRAAARVWSPDPGEGFRALGLETDPNSLGALALAVFVWAATSRDKAVARVAVGAMSILAIMLSASRTSLFAAVAVGVATGVHALWTRRDTQQPSETPRAARTRLVIVLLVAVGVATVALTAGGMLSRLAESVNAVPGAVHGGEGSSHLIEQLDGVTNGRATRWIAGFDTWLDHPLGSFMLPDVVVGTHIHSEYLERLVWGGPIMLLAFVFVLMWLALRFKPRAAPAFGLGAALAWGVAAAALYATHLPGFATMLFFGIGVTASAHDSPPAKRGQVRSS
jgi:hypothetical protein